MKKYYTKDSIGKSLLGLAACGLVTLACIPVQAQEAIAGGNRVTVSEYASESILPIPGATLTIEIFKRYAPYQQLVSKYLDKNTPEVEKKKLRNALWSLDKTRVHLEAFKKEFRLFNVEDSRKKVQIEGIIREVLDNKDMTIAEFCVAINEKSVEIEKILHTNIVTNKVEIYESLSARN